MMIEEILKIAIENKATDIHMRCGEFPFLRVGHHLQCIDTYIVKEDDFYELRHLCDGREQALAEGEYSYDGSFGYKDIRVRVHLFRAEQTLCGTLRLLFNRLAILSDDGEDNVLRKLSSLKDGMVLIAGPTGSGKSFTLAACLEFINQTMEKHIITLEDPIEYVFTQKHSLIHQRQLGDDMRSMSEGVRDALREDPDVIMIGELRDRNTLKASLNAAETGHLVFATVHTQRAVMAVNRMISMFPSEDQEEARSQISQVLRAVICQHLIIAENSFIPIRDILLNTSAVANLIRQRKEPQIISIQQTQPPMQTMEMAIEKIRHQKGAIPELEEMTEQSYELV